MLVLTRKYQEKIRIGDNITITVLRTKGKAVRLGIEAPADVPVIRGELSFERPTAVPVAVPAASASSFESTAAAEAPCQRAMPRRSESPSSWTTDPPRLGERARATSPSSQVRLARVPRDKVAEILPPLVSGSRPLRGMMDRR